MCTVSMKERTGREGIGGGREKEREEKRERERRKERGREREGNPNFLHYNFYHITFSQSTTHVTVNPYTPTMFIGGCYFNLEIR